MIMRHMKNEMSESALECGGRFSSSAVGGSVARASAAIVSMMRLTHSSCTAVSTDCPWSSEMALTNVKNTAVWYDTHTHRVGGHVSTRCVDGDRTGSPARATYDVDGQLELQKLAHRVVHGATPNDRLDDRGKVVVHNDNVRGLLGDLGTRNAHRKTHIGQLECRAVVGPVARHRHRVAAHLEPARVCPTASVAMALASRLVIACTHRPTSSCLSVGDERASTSRLGTRRSIWRGYQG
jgi:hypothetical protein